MKKILRWYYGNASIRKKLIYSYALLVSIPLLVLGIYSYRISRRNLLMQTEDTIKSNVSIIASSLNDSMQRENDNIRYLSYNAGFREKLQNAGKDMNGLVKELNNSVEPAFWYFITSDENLKGIRIYSPNVENAVGSFLLPMSAEEEPGWYEEHQEDFGTEWEYQNRQIFASRIILDANRSSEPIGFIRIELFPDKFLAPIFQSQFLDNGVALLDDKNNVIGKRSLKDKELDGSILKIIQEESPTGVCETADYMMAASDELANGWCLYYYIDKSEISAQMNAIYISTGLIVGLCLIIIFIFISIISKILGSRILQLKYYAEEVSRGNYSMELTTECTDEIGIVTNSFQEMCDRINQMMEDMYQLGLKKRAEELKALQAKINPHFLYNCLSSIKWKAIRSDQDEIAEVTGQLAKFYRTTLNSGRQITTVENELSNIKSYLELQKRTHEDSFHVEFYLSEEGRELPMPNFLLQPIVENAICHGIDYREEGTEGKIIIHYSLRDGYIIFEIMNNGPALSSEEAERLLNTPGKGYGLHNIRERVKIYYGSDENCGISGRLTEDGMVCFTVTLKQKVDMEEEKPD